jgi:two-component system, NtrC family, response regulator GlrR
MRSPDKARVLVVDDDVELCTLLSLRLEASGYDVSCKHAVADAVRVIGLERVDAILLDLRLGAENGFDVLDAVRKRAPDVPVIVLTAHGSIETAVDAMSRGAFGFLTKPFHDHELLQKLAHAVESCSLHREVAGLRRIVGATSEERRLLGVSASIERVRETIVRVAKVSSTVLVLGESGTGKELVARSIHSLSTRAQGPFVAVNCAALAPEILESTLFGHVKGAFTGALSNHEGLFGAAHGGTLFLDEVGEASLGVQAKLLRVLEERRYSRVGSTTESAVDVRVIAATNRDLKQETAERRFREDLYYRLHVIPIVMPSLRDRGEDILLLAEVFLERAAARHGLPVPRVSARARAALLQHTWPGNVRELANVMEAAALLHGQGEVEPEDLPGVGLRGEQTDEVERCPDFASQMQSLLGRYTGARDAEPPTLRDARDLLDRAYLNAVLARTSGNVTLAAKLAGRNRTDLYDLLRRHGLTAADAKRREP